MIFLSEDEWEYSGCAVCGCPPEENKAVTAYFNIVEAQRYPVCSSFTAQTLYVSSGLSLQDGANLVPGELYELRCRRCAAEVAIAGMQVWVPELDTRFTLCFGTEFCVSGDCPAWIVPPPEDSIEPEVETHCAACALRPADEILDWEAYVIDHEGELRARSQR